MVHHIIPINFVNFLNDFFHTDVTRSWIFPFLSLSINEILWNLARYFFVPLPVGMYINRVEPSFASSNSVKFSKFMFELGSFLSQVIRTRLELDKYLSKKQARLNFPLFLKPKTESNTAIEIGETHTHNLRWNEKNEVFFFFFSFFLSFFFFSLSLRDSPKI